jgi:hypothetical protein
MRRFSLLTAFVASLGFVTLASASAEEDRILLGLGAFAFNEENGGDLAAEARIEYLSGWRVFDQAFGPRFRGLGPYVALNVNTDGGVFGAGGLFLDLRPLPGIYLRPFGGVGGYSEGAGRDLGGVFQFETGAAAGYRFDNQTEVGILFKHYSNANINDDNPGVNSIMLTVSMPLDFRLGD